MCAGECRSAYAAVSAHDAVARRAIGKILTGNMVVCERIRIVHDGSGGMMSADARQTADAAERASMADSAAVHRSSDGRRANAAQMATTDMRAAQAAITTNVAAT